MWTKEQYKAYAQNAYRYSKEWLRGPWWFREKDQIAKFTGWVAAYTAILMGVAFLQFCTLQNTDKTTREALIAVQRAFVVVSGMTDETQQGPDGKIVSERYSILEPRSG